jgi:hypothetical protein
MILSYCIATRQSRNETGKADRKITDRKMGFLLMFLSPIFLSAGAPVGFLAACEESRLLQCPTALSFSLGADFNSSFIIRPSSFALPGRSTAAARLRSWRWGETARKPAKLAY